MRAAGAEVESFTTPTARPVVATPEARNVTGGSVYLHAQVVPHHSETRWRFEYATSLAQLEKGEGLHGPSGTVSQAEAEALPEGTSAAGVEGALSGLQPSTTYFVRLFAENAAGEGVSCYSPNNSNEEVCEPVLTSKHHVASFVTAGAPRPVTLETSALHGSSVRVLASVEPGGAPTSEEQTVTLEPGVTGGTFTLSFEGHVSEPVGYHASAEALANALAAIPGLQGCVGAGGVDGGPYRVFFVGGCAGVNEPQLVGDGSGLSPAGAVTVSTAVEGGSGVEASYDFQYVSDVQFRAPGALGGFAQAASTTPLALQDGAAAGAVTVGQDLPVLSPGETYHYRVVASNRTPGDPSVAGGEQVLTAPVAPEAAAAGVCPNEALRTGASANLPDCRAYEQVTPVDKEGAQEIFKWSGLKVAAYALVGEDGNHLMLQAPVKWGSGPAAGEAPYFFSRGATGWGVTAATVQPEAGLDEYTPQVSDQNVSRLGLLAGSATFGTGQSPTVEFKAGPPGGPYALVASVPRKALVGSDGWVAASSDFSKLVLQVEDHRVVEPQTTTKTGADLYEYAGGALRQVNVGVGSCGANIVHGSRRIQRQRKHGSGNCQQRSCASRVMVRGFSLKRSPAPTAANRDTRSCVWAVLKHWIWVRTGSSPLLLTAAVCCSKRPAVKAPGSTLISRAPRRNFCRGRRRSRARPTDLLVSAGLEAVYATRAAC